MKINWKYMHLFFGLSLAITFIVSLKFFPNSSIAALLIGFLFLMTGISNINRSVQEKKLEESKGCSDEEYW